MLTVKAIGLSLSSLMLLWLQCTYHILQKFKVRRTEANLPGCGSRREIDDKLRRKIILMVTKNPENLAWNLPQYTWTSHKSFERMSFGELRLNWSFLAKHISSRFIKVEKKQTKKGAATLMGNLVLFWDCTQLAQGVLNVFRVQWNLKSVKTFWRETCCLVSKSLVSAPGHGSAKRIMIQNTKVVPSRAHLQNKQFLFKTNGVGNEISLDRMHL